MKAGISDEASLQVSLVAYIGSDTPGKGITLHSCSYQPATSSTCM
jgi:hypothetical protein